MRKVDLDKYSFYNVYWHGRTMDKTDLVGSLWLANGHVPNSLYHFLKDFAVEVWSAALDRNR